MFWRTQSDEVVDGRLNIIYGLNKLEVSVFWRTQSDELSN